MEFRTYEEFYEDLKKLLPNFEIILGTSKDRITGDTCFISQRGTETVYSDGQPMILSATYDLIFLQKRAVFANREVIELLDEVNFSLYDDDSGLNIFTSQITLYGPGAVPSE